MRMNAYREAWRLAWPLILSNLSVPLLGITDTAVVGHLPDPHYLGAVAIGALVFSVVYFAFGFLRMGTTGLTGQAYGRGDRAELRAGLVRPLTLALAIGLVCLLSAGLLVRVSGWLFEPSPAVAASLETYLRIRLFGAPAGLANMVLLGWLLGLQNARGPMALLIATNALNIALDLIFVLGLGLAVPGVAAATVCAEYGGLGLGIWLASRALGRLGGRWRWSVIARAEAFRRLIAVNRDIFLRSLCLEGAFVTFTALGSRRGEVILAANAILLNFQLFAAFGLDGFAHAAEAMVGRHVGAGDPAGFRAATSANLVWSLLLALIVALGFWLGGPLAIRLMTGLPEVQAAARTFLPYMVASPVVSVWAFLFDGVFIGATRTPEMRNGMLLALAAFLLAAWALVPALGNHGLWLAFLTFMAARGLWLGLVYLHIERGPGFAAARLPLSDRAA
jgi:multidrug resistance protein, MATE family